MYDLSGLKPGQTQALIDDWKHLNDHLRQHCKTPPSPA